MAAELTQILQWRLWELCWQIADPHRTCRCVFRGCACRWKRRCSSCICFFGGRARRWRSRRRFCKRFCGCCAHRWRRRRSPCICFFGGCAHRWKSRRSSCKSFWGGCAHRCQRPRILGTGPFAGRVGTSGGCRALSGCDCCFLSVSPSRPALACFHTSCAQQRKSNHPITAEWSEDTEQRSMCTSPTLQSLRSGTSFRYFHPFNLQPSSTVSKNNQHTLLGFSLGLCSRQTAQGLSSKRVQLGSSDGSGNHCAEHTLYAHTFL